MKTPASSNCESRKTAASHARPQPFREPVVDSSSQKTTYQHGQKRQHGVKRARLQIQATHFREITIEPAEENPCHIAVAEVAERNGPHFFALQDAPPRHERLRIIVRFAVLLASVRSESTPTQRQTRQRCSAGVSRAANEPDRSRGKSDDGAHPERRPPTVMNHDVSDDQAA